MKTVNRRDFLKLTGSSLIGVTLGGVALRANAQEQLAETDPTAVALKYVHVSKVEGAYCDNCMYIHGCHAQFSLEKLWLRKGIVLLGLKRAK